MFHRVQAGRAQDVEQVAAFGHGPGGQLVDMPPDEVVGVFVVAAEHDLIRKPGQQPDQRLEIAGGATLSDQDLYAQAGLLQAFLIGETLVVGGDALAEIFDGILPPQTRRVPVDGFAGPFGGGEFGHHLGYVVHHAREVHHFRQVIDIGPLEEALHNIRPHMGAGGLEIGGRHAGGHAETDLQGRLRGAVEHVQHAFLPQYIGDLVRVGDGADRAVHHRHPAEFGWGEHAALDVYMRIDKAGHEVMGAGTGQGADGLDAPVFYANFGVVNFPPVQVDQVGLKGELGCHGLRLTDKYPKNPALFNFRRS